MRSNQDLCTPEEILRVEDRDIAQFIRDQIQTKRLSRTMELLNARLESHDHTSRDLAARAIERLGFSVDS